MTAQIISPVGMMKSLGAQVEQLKAAHHSEFIEMCERHRRALEPLQARLGMLQRRCYREDDLIAELQTLRDRWWELEERIVAVAGLDDHELENDDTAARRKIRWRMEEIEHVLKVLGKDSENHGGTFEAPSAEIASRVERAKWMAELKKWPRPFVVGLSREIEIKSAPERVRTQFSTNELSYARCDALEGLNEGYTHKLSQAFEYLRERRAAGDVEEGKRRVLWVLFAYGKRRIVREDVQPMAERMVRDELRYAIDRLTRVRKWMGRIERRLTNPVYAKGPKKGMPLSEERQQTLELEFAQYRAEVTKLERSLQRLSDPDPLYASGFRRRPARPSQDAKVAA